eukprot:gene26684-32245_t
MERSSSVEICIIWQNIVVDFYDVFHDAFKNNKKAHFDCLQPPYNLVDGARSKWCIPQLLDVLIFFFEFDVFKPAVRRDFNQQKLLADCVLKELKVQCSRLSLESLHSSTPIPITISEVVYPWNSVDSVRTIVVKSPPSKSKKKYVEVVNQLCNHLSSIMQDQDLAHVIKTVVSKLLCMIDPRSLCIKHTPCVYARPSLLPNHLLAYILGDRVGQLGAVPLHYPLPSEAAVKTAGSGAETKAGDAVGSAATQGGSNADDEFIVDTFALETKLYHTAPLPPLPSPSPVHASILIDPALPGETLPTSSPGLGEKQEDVEEEDMFECCSIPDQDIMCMDMDDMCVDMDGDEISEFDAYVDSLETASVGSHHSYHSQQSHHSYHSQQSQHSHHSYHSQHSQFSQHTYTHPYPSSDILTSSSNPSEHTQSYSDQHNNYFLNPSNSLMQPASYAFAPRGYVDTEDDDTSSHCSRLSRRSAISYPDCGHADGGEMSELGEMGELAIEDFAMVLGHSGDMGWADTNVSDGNGVVLQDIGKAGFSVPSSP